MKNYLIIDIGTSSLRVAIMNEKLDILRTEVKKRSVEVCFSAEEEWQNLFCMMKQIIQSEKREMDGIAVSSLLGWVGIDKDGNAVTPCYSYMHQCIEEYEEFRQKYTDDIIYPISRRCISSELAIFKLLELKKNHQDIYGKMSKFISLKDFINRKITGIAAIDHTSASYTMLYDVQNEEWSQDILEYSGLDREKLANLVRPYEAVGHPLDEIAAELGISSDIPVAAGSVDGSTGILGAGAVNAKTAVSVMGTTEVFFMVEDRLPFDKTKSIIVNPHVIPGLWLVGGPMGMYGGTLDWMLNNIMNRAFSVKQMDELAGNIPAGSEGVVFVPSLAGERAPFWNPQVRGTVVGMEYKHKAEHLFRAIMEANGYSIRKTVETGRDNGVCFDRVYAIGGGSKSDVWLQLKADIIGTAFERPAIEEATMAGACLLAMMAGGIKALPKAKVIKSFSANMKEKEKYDFYYEKYMRIHDKIVDLYN